MVLFTLAPDGLRGERRSRRVVLSWMSGPGGPPTSAITIPTASAVQRCGPTRRHNDTSGPTGQPQRHLRSNGAAQPEGATTPAVQRATPQQKDAFRTKTGLLQRHWIGP